MELNVQYLFIPDKGILKMFNLCQYIMIGPPGDWVFIPPYRMQIVRKEEDFIIGGIILIHFDL